MFCKKYNLYIITVLDLDFMQFGKFSISYKTYWIFQGIYSWSVVDKKGTIDIKTGIPLLVILKSQFKVRIVIVDKSRYG